MTKLEKLTKRVEIAKKAVSQVAFELKDRSFRRAKGYFGTEKADTTGLILVYSFTRTKYLNTYVCVNPEYSDLVETLRNAENELNREKTRIQKIALKRWAKQSIEYCRNFTDKQISEGTVNTPYVKMFFVGNNNIYGCSPDFGHSDYNKFKAMPNNKYTRRIANELNQKIQASITQVN